VVRSRPANGLGELRADVDHLKMGATMKAKNMVLGHVVAQRDAMGQRLPRAKNITVEADDAENGRRGQRKHLMSR